MAEQLDLFADDKKTKTIIYVPIDDLVLSEFNPRVQRGKDDIKKLAERIKRNGFEVTRALWAYAEGDKYAVFAGGTRLQAAELAKVDTVPVVLHSGYDDAEIARLAYEENENDEYHIKVPMVDVWADYKNKIETLGWTHQQLADSLGVIRRKVGYRLQYANFPKSVLLKIGTKDFLNEGQMRELLSLEQCSKLDPWLTTESALHHVIDAVISKTKTPTANNFKTEVNKLNSIIKQAQGFVDALPSDNYKNDFIADLQKNKVMSTAAIQGVFTKLSERIAKDEARKKLELEMETKKQTEKEREAARTAFINREVSLATNRIFIGDSLTANLVFGKKIKLLLTDPPYGVNFQSNRRKASNQLEKIKNDDGLENALELFENVIKRFISRMDDDSTIMAFSSQLYEPDFRKKLVDLGFTYRDTYIWSKPNHGSGDLAGTFAPKHECIIHAVKGNPKLNTRPNSILGGKEFLDTDHPTPKPLDLLDIIIEATTNESELVFDPFCGVGSVLVSAYRKNRDFSGCDISKKWGQAARDNIYNLAVNKIKTEEGGA